MGSIVRRWESAIESLMTREHELSAHAIEVLNLASELDSLERGLAENARHMQQVMGRAAEEFARGNVSSSSDPTGYSTLRQIAEGVTKHQAKREAMMSLVRVWMGPPASKRLVEILQSKGGV